MEEGIATTAQRSSSTKSSNDNDTYAIPEIDREQRPQAHWRFHKRNEKPRHQLFKEPALALKRACRIQARSMGTGMGTYLLDRVREIFISARPVTPTRAMTNRLAFDCALGSRGRPGVERGRPRSMTMAPASWA